MSHHRRECSRAGSRAPFAAVRATAAQLANDGPRDQSRFESIERNAKEISTGKKAWLRCEAFRHVVT